ncbi:MAG: flavin reductase family protein [Steroidobacteraceae bacterium]
MDPRELRRVFGLFATGVTVITAVGPGPEPVGVTANSVASVSLDPPLILWCLANRSSSLAAFELGAPFAIHILAEHQTEVALHFAKAGRSKFEVDDWWRTHPEPPTIDGALARIACRVSQRYAGGAHTIIVGAIEACSARDAAPLAFHASRFGRFVQAPASAKVEVWPDPRDVWM